MAEQPAVNPNRDTDPVYSVRPWCHCRHMITVALIQVALNGTTVIVAIIDLLYRR